jgi:hypothetical protein
MDQLQLKIIYLAMMQVARTEASEEELEKYEELAEDISTYHDLEVRDVIDNLETVYNMIDKSVFVPYKD